MLDRVDGRIVCDIGYSAIRSITMQVWNKKAKGTQELVVYAADEEGAKSGTETTIKSARARTGCWMCDRGRTLDLWCTSNVIEYYRTKMRNFSAQ